MFRDHVKLAMKNLRHRLSRSLLTLLRIAIGIMAIISLMALGEGMQQAITGELSSISDVIIVSIGGDFYSSFLSGGSTTEYFTDRDLSDVQRVQGIRDVTTQLSGTAIAEYNRKISIVSLTGMEAVVMRLQYASQFRSARIEAVLEGGGRVWIVGGVQAPPAGQAPPRLPPPPLPESGWNSEPYEVAWSMEISALLRRHTTRSLDVATPRAREYAYLRVSEGWR